MESAQLNWLTNFIWNIADDVLRDVYVRGKYRDVILPMTVLRRLDAVLEPTKAAVLEMKAALDREGVTNQDDALRAASGQAFYNISPFLLQDLKSRATQQKLKDDFEAYLDGFSPNVQDILNNFEFRNQIPRLSKADALGLLIEKFLDKELNLSPEPMEDLPGLDNHSMGTMFEELVRRFNEDNNEEAAEHWTPRDAVRLIANLMFLPVAEKIESGTYLLYDCACGTGGMLTVAEETLQQIAQAHGKQVATHLYGQEINGEIYAICKADLLLKGDGDADEEEDGEGSAKKGLSDKVKKRLLDQGTWKRDSALLQIGQHLRETLGEEVFDDHNVFLQSVDAAIRRRNVKLSAGDLKQIIGAVSWRDESAAPVIKKVHKPGKAKADPLRGLYDVKVDGKAAVVEYEPDSELRDFEQIPLLEEGGIDAFIRREVCRTRRMRGLSRPTRRSATKSASLATSTSRPSFAPLPRSVRISSPLSRRLKAY